MRIPLCALLVLTGPLLTPNAPAQAQRDRPNIIFIMTDDHAAHAIGAYGSRVNKTPHLDRLAREGALFTSVFATNSICTPSRAAILTGQYSHLNGVTMFNRFDSSRMTVARLLQQGGYYTGMIGKWHLGSDPAGFDRWEILPGQGAYRNPVFYTATGEKTYTGRYATDVITDLALEFVENRPRDKPFFLMMHHKAPHRPWEPSDDTRRTLRDATDSGTGHVLGLVRDTHRRAAREPAARRGRSHEPRLETDAAGGPERAGAREWLTSQAGLGDDQSRDGKSVTLTGEALVRWKYQRYMQDYLATVQSVDDSVGRVLALLDKAGLARNTIVVYTSDQGFFLGDHGMFDKRFMYEESIRMPFLVRWPAGIRPGTKSDALALEHRFRADVSRARRAADAARDAGPQPVASCFAVARRPIGARRCTTATTTTLAITTRSAHYGVRTRTHKLIYFWKKDQWELFDLVNDPYELHNLYGEPGQEALTATLKAELARLKRRCETTISLRTSNCQTASTEPWQS